MKDWARPVCGIYRVDGRGFRCDREKLGFGEEVKCHAAGGDACEFVFMQREVTRNERADGIRKGSDHLRNSWNPGHLKVKSPDQECNNDHRKWGINKAYIWCRLNSSAVLVISSSSPSEKSTANPALSCSSRSCWILLDITYIKKHCTIIINPKTMIRVSSMLIVSL